MTPERTAIVYDFDGTLARGNIQEHTFIPELGIEPTAFWAEVRAQCVQHDADQVLTYMRLMVERSNRRQLPITRELLRRHGAATPLFDGVPEWFERMNGYAAERGLGLEHYVISSGILEMIAGCPIFGRFKKVFASTFVYDDDGRAVWPGIAINYTTKTQFLFRINKGVLNSWDNASVNRWMPMQERPLPFSRMIFIGDGDTDIPSMKTVRLQGGQAIAVFDPERWRPDQSQANIYRLIAEDRVHFVAPADYRAGSQLDVIVRGILGRIARENGYRGD
jgi:haloacid dehalogenase-like hydrolase